MTNDAKTSSATRTLGLPPGEPDMRSFLLVASLLAAVVVPGFPSALADGCGYSDGSRQCAFSCEGASNAVYVTVSVSGWYNQWRSVEGKAYCGAALSAMCAGNGDCSGSGTGAFAGGACTGWASGGTISGGCAANKISADVGTLPIKINGDDLPPNSAFFRGNAQGPLEGTVCDDAQCVPVVPVCIAGVGGIACGIGVTEEILATLYPAVFDGVHAIPPLGLP